MARWVDRLRPKINAWRNKKVKFSLISIFLNGYVGYFVVDAKWPAFYYEPVSDGKNVWLFLQLACMAGFALGVVLAFNDIRRATRSMA